MSFSPKRKVFVSYYHGDQDTANKFVQDFSDVFIAKTVGIKDGNFDINSICRIPCSALLNTNDLFISLDIL